MLQRFDAMLVLYRCDLYPQLYTQGSEQDLMAHLRPRGLNVTMREQTQDGGWMVATNTALDRWVKQEPSETVRKIADAPAA